MNQHCPVCGDQAVKPYGNPMADFLIVEEQPYISLGEPKMSKYKDDISPFQIIKTEISKADMNISMFRIVSVLPHSEGKDARCWEAGISHVLEEMENMRGIILVGSRVCEFFLGYKSKDVMGLSGLVSSLFSDAEMMVVPSIKSVYSSGAGELQLALQRFARVHGAIL